ncbi:MAG: hypothetical protein V8T45_07275 [Oscillospiraceae bacterium]
MSGGAIALGGQVLLVFNQRRYAGINRMNIAQAGDIVMDGDMNATGRAYLAQLAGGAVSVGMTTSYVAGRLQYSGAGCHRLCCKRPERLHVHRP